jgi:hypothetical protein
VPEAREEEGTASVPGERVEGRTVELFPPWCASGGRGEVVLEVRGVKRGSESKEGVGEGVLRDEQGDGVLRAGDGVLRAGEGDLRAGDGVLRAGEGVLSRGDGRISEWCLANSLSSLAVSVWSLVVASLLTPSNRVKASKPSSIIFMRLAFGVSSSSSPPFSATPTTGSWTALLEIASGDWVE